MIWIGYLLTTLFVIGLAALKAGEIDFIFSKISAIAALILIIPFYFMSREKKEPTRVEALFAGTWIVLRRLVGILGFLLIGVPCVAVTIRAFSTGFTLSGAAAVIFGIFVSFFILWKGWYGEGASKRLSDDRPSHEARKKRYGWK
ncbi:MAG: hypothetical protein ACRERR_13860 [Moraxellaceae bacterium]